MLVLERFLVVAEYQLGSCESKGFSKNATITNFWLVALEVLKYNLIVKKTSWLYVVLHLSLC